MPETALALARIDQTPRTPQKPQDRRLPWLAPLAGCALFSSISSSLTLAFARLLYYY
jgi:hypothetical protein